MFHLGKLHQPCDTGIRLQLLRQVGCDVGGLTDHFLLGRLGFSEYSLIVGAMFFIEGLFDSVQGSAPNEPGGGDFHRLFRSARGGHGRLILRLLFERVIVLTVDLTGRIGCRGWIVPSATNCNSILLMCVSALFADHPLVAPVRANLRRVNDCT